MQAWTDAIDDVSVDEPDPFRSEADVLDQLH
jgi:hypothetical protein